MTFSHARLAAMRAARAMAAAALLLSAALPAAALDAARGVPLPPTLFPATNWWNLDISAWPVDANSASYIAFINNGGTRRLHPDFGGDDPGSPNAIYGLPYAVVSGVSAADRLPVDFLYWDESDGVDRQSGAGLPFYPIPPAAITQSRWIEGGDPGNVDARSRSDRHLLVVDRDRNHLYELYNVYYDTARGRWLGGSGAFFDMNTNDRRPEGWTSADAAGLAILPGLVRYDEAYDAALPEIRHAFRVTVRATNGYVYPASHRAGSTAGALPLGARLRLKASVDVNQRTADPNVRKIFRAMQRHGLIVADNGSDLYVTGTYDTRWNNSVLNPAFAALTASDFEVIQLGYNPPVAAEATLSALSVSPSVLAGGAPAVGSVSLTAPAPAGGLAVALASANAAVTTPASVTVPAAATSATFAVATAPVAAVTSVTLSATAGGVSRTALVTVNPPATVAVLLESLALDPATVKGGSTSTGIVTLSGAAPAGGAVVALSSGKPSVASVPAQVVVPAGARSASFAVTTVATRKRSSVAIDATFEGVTRRATLTVQR